MIFQGGKLLNQSKGVKCHLVTLDSQQNIECRRQMVLVDVTVGCGRRGFAHPRCQVCTASCGSDGGAGLRAGGERSRHHRREAGSSGPLKIPTGSPQMCDEACDEEVVQRLGKRITQLPERAIG